MELFAQVPHPRKPKLCVWTDLNVHQMDQILQCGSTSDCRALLQRLFCIGDSARGQILLDLYLHAIKFSTMQKFSKEQTSVFFSIVKQTHDVCTSTPFGNVEECFLFFRELVLIHSVHRPPWSLEIFNTEQIETITKHVINTYFRHYKLYKYAFTPRVKLDLTFEYEGLAPSPPPVIEEPQDDLGAGSESVPTPVLSEQQEAEQTVEVEEADESMHELEKIVRKAVAAQLKQMHMTVEQQLEDTDKAINDKIHALELNIGSPRGAKTRSPKHSAKGKRK